MPAPEPVLPPAAEERRACRNCGETLLGPYCSRCGQEDLDLHRPLKQLAQDAAGDLLNLDTRLLRTLGPLVFRPGFVIREYLAGRRVRFVPPLKMFLLASVVFFGLVALLPRATVVVSQGGETPKSAPQAQGPRVDFKLPQREESSWIGRRLNQGSRKAEKDPQAFGEAVLANLPRVFFVLLPLFALLLKQFYRRQDKYYLDHLIFALYHHAFGFVVLSLLVVVGRPWVPEWLTTTLVPVLCLWFFVYLALALRKVYGGSWWKTVLKLIGLLSIYFFVFVGTLVPLLLVTLWWF